MISFDIWIVENYLIGFGMDVRSVGLILLFKSHGLDWGVFFRTTFPLANLEVCHSTWWLPKVVLCFSFGTNMIQTGIIQISNKLIHLPGISLMLVYKPWFWSLWVLWASYHHRPIGEIGVVFAKCNIFFVVPTLFSDTRIMILDQLGLRLVEKLTQSSCTLNV